MKQNTYIFPSGTYTAACPIAALILCNAALIAEGKKMYWGNFLDERGNSFCFSQPQEKINTPPDADAYYSR
jgi:hypothetical protein